MAHSDEEKAAQIVANAIEQSATRVMLAIFWATRKVIVAVLLAGGLASSRSRRSLRVPNLSNSEKSDAESIAERITRFE
jgi:hypothetical protein